MELDQSLARKPFTCRCGEKSYRHRSKFKSEEVQNNDNAELLQDKATTGGNETGG